MDEIKEFVRELEELEFEIISVEVSGFESRTIYLTDVVNEVEKLGMKEIIDTYLEGIEFINNDNNIIGLFAVC